MARNYFLGWAEAELLVARRAAQDELVAGASIASVSGGDTTISQAQQIGILTRLDMIEQALNAIDPTTYPLADITPIDRTTYAHPA